MANERATDIAEVVFVCTGNRARSPLAASLLTRRVAGLPVRVSSFGTSDLGLVPVLPQMAVAAQQLGVDLSGHRARCIPRRGLGDVDLLLGFEPFHVAAAVVDGGAPAERAFTLAEFVPLASGVDAIGSDDVRARIAHVVQEAHRRRTTPRLSAPEIADPLGRPAGVFAAVAREIDDLVGQLADVLTGPPDRTATLAR